MTVSPAAAPAFPDPTSSTADPGPKDENLAAVADAWIDAAYPAGPDQQPVTVDQDVLLAAVAALDAGQALPDAFVKATTPEQQQQLADAHTEARKPPPPPPVDESPGPTVLERLSSLEDRVAALEKAGIPAPVPLPPTPAAQVGT